MELNIASLGRIEREFQVLPTLAVKLHTLNYEEQLQASKSMPKQEENLMEFHQTMMMSVLGVATSELVVEGKVYNIKQAIDNMYRQMQNKLVSEIYKHYISLVEEQGNVIDELKKNSKPVNTSPQKITPSVKS